MAMPWEAYQSTDEIALPTGSYKSEAGLRQVAAFSPESMNQINESEAQSWNDDELTKEMSRKDLSPAAIKALNEEKIRRSSLTKPTEAGSPWEQYGTPWDNYESTSSLKPKHAMADIVGGAAAGLDTVLPIGSAIGGVHGLSRLATGQGLDRSVEAINEDSSALNLGKLLEKFYPDAYEQYKLANVPTEKFQDLVHEAGGKVSDVTGSPALGAATNVIGQALPFILGERALSKGTIRPDAAALKKEKGYSPNVDSWEPEAPKPPSTFEELAAKVKEAEVKPEESAFSKKEIADMNKTRKKVSEPYEQAIVENQNRYATSEEGLRQKDLFSGEADRPVPGESTASTPDLFDPVSDTIKRQQDEVARTQEIEQAWNSHDRDQEIAQLIEKGRLNLDQANPSVLEPLVKDTSNEIDIPRMKGQMKIASGQRGAVNFGIADEVAQRIKALKEGSQRVDRNLDELKVGQQVRLMNGKTATIKAVADGRYSVEGQGFKDSVPRQGIDYAYKPMGMNSFGKSQRGSVDMNTFLGKKTLDELSKMSDSLMARMRGAKFNSPEWHQIREEIAALNPVWQTKIDEAMKAKEGKEEQFRQDFRDAAQNIGSGIREVKALARRAEFTDVNKPLGQTKFGKGQSGGINLGAFFGSKEKTVPLEEIPPSDYSKLDSEAQRASADLRPWEMLKEQNGYTKHDKNGKVIPYQFGKNEDMSGVKSLWQPRHILEQSQWNKETVKVFKNIASRISELDNKRAQTLNALREHLSDYAALSRSDMKGLMQTMINYDGMKNDTLAKAGLQWASTDMLKADGLSDKQIKAYQTLTKGLDKAWGLIESAFKAMGKDAPDRIPGYFPHFWTGSWRVMIKDTDGKPVEIKAFATKWGAMAEMRQADKMGLITERIDPTSHLKEANFVPELIQALEVYKNKKGLNGKILDKLLALNEYTQRGIVKDVLEREGVKGYDAEQGIKPEFLGYNKWHNDRLLKAYDNHFENVARFSNNVNVIKDVAAPLYRDFGMFENTPHFRDAVTDFIGRATGNEVNHIGKFDQLVRSIMMTTGMPVHGAHQMLFELNRFMTWSKLNSTNVGFVLSNVVQPILAIGDLTQIHQDRVNAGLPTASPYKAVATLLKEVANIQQGGGSKDFREAVQWAYENNKIDTSSPTHLDPLKNSSATAKLSYLVFQKLGQTVEERGRIASFLGAYSYFKDVMPKREALEAAANRMNIMMGNYERMNASAMYTDYGITGTAFKPFAQLRNTYYGRAGQAIDTMKNIDWKNPKSIGGAGLPFGIMMGSYLVGAGISGLLGSAEYDALVTAYNAAVNPDHALPMMGELARKAGLPDWTIFGWLGIGTGVNIGPSVAAPAFTEAGGAPGLQAGANMATLGVEGVKAAVTGTPNTEKIYSAVKRLAPPMLSPWIEDYIAKHQGDNVPHSTNFDATRPRTEEEDNLFKMYGKRSISEEGDRQVLRYNNIEDQQVAKWKKDKVNEIVSSILGYSASSKDTGELVEEALRAERGFDAKSLRENIKDELKRRVTPEYLRKMQAIAKSKNDVDKARKLQQIQELMRTK